MPWCTCPNSAVVSLRSARACASRGGRTAVACVATLVVFGVASCASRPKDPTPTVRISPAEGAPESLSGDGRSTATGTMSPVVETEASRPNRPWSTATPTAVPPELAQAYTSLASSMDGLVGMAFAGGQSSTSIMVVGDWRTGPAWSTIKVPVALATLAGSHSYEDVARSRAAITESDNGAAQELWDSMGGGRAAAGRVDTVLSAHDDPKTRTQSSVTRRGFSVFGQTQWSLAAQASFTRALACDPRSRPLLEFMGSVIPSQRWGLGRWPEARFKGGWGPDTSGSYTVRQFGLLPTAHGEIAVALAVSPADGAFATATRQLDEIEAWLAAYADVLPTFRCV